MQMCGQKKKYIYIYHKHDTFQRIFENTNKGSCAIIKIDLNEWVNERDVEQWLWHLVEIVVYEQSNEFR